MPVVRHGIQTEPVPDADGQQRMDFHRPVRARSQAHKTGNDKVGVGGMLVLRAAFGLRVLLGAFDFPRNPDARIRVQVFINPGNDPPIGERAALASGVAFQGLKIILPGEGILRASAIEQIGRRRERLRGGEGPGRAVPLAVVAGVGDPELRMPPLGSGRPEGRIKAARVHELFPGGLMPGIGQIEIPGQEPVQFAGIGQRAVWGAHFEKLRAGVPQKRLHAVFERGGFGVIFGGNVRLSGQTRGGGNRAGIPVEIRINRRPLVFLCGVSR